MVHAVTEISSEATASYRQRAREQGDGYTYSHTRQTIIYFGSSLETSEAYIGAKGTLTEHREETWEILRVLTKLREALRTFMILIVIPCGGLERKPL